MSEKSFDERREALKARVKKQLEESSIQDSEPELIVPQSELMLDEDSFESMMEFEYDDKARLRKLAAVLILVGSLLGIFSGGIILQGNPSELLNSSLFEQTQSVDITGQALDIEGQAIFNASIELVDYESSETLQVTYTNDNGYFQLKNVKSETMLLRVSLEGYNTIERTFDAVDGIMQPFTMKNGSEITKETVQSEDSGWSLEAAVGLSTFIGVMTIITGIVGIQASVETRRAKRYRRTQYLAGISLFSRGLI